MNCYRNYFQHAHLNIPWKLILSRSDDDGRWKHVCPYSDHFAACNTTDHQIILRRLRQRWDSVIWPVASLAFLNRGGGGIVWPFLHSEVPLLCSWFLLGRSDMCRALCWRPFLFYFFSPLLGCNGILENYKKHLVHFDCPYPVHAGYAHWWHDDIRHPRLCLQKLAAKLWTGVASAPGPWSLLVTSLDLTLFGSSRSCPLSARIQFRACRSSSCWSSSVTFSAEYHRNQFSNWSRFSFTRRTFTSWSNVAFCARTFMLNTWRLTVQSSYWPSGICSSSSRPASTTSVTTSAATVCSGRTWRRLRSCGGAPTQRKSGRQWSCNAVDICLRHRYLSEFQSQHWRR